MNTSHRFITALVATGALLVGSAISGDAVAQSRPTLQGLEAQADNSSSPEGVGAARTLPPRARVPQTGQTTCLNLDTVQFGV